MGRGILTTLVVCSCVAINLAAPTQLTRNLEGKTDLHGDPLPPTTVARLGTVRFRGEIARATDNKSLATLRRNRVVFVDPDTGAERREFPGPNPLEFEVWSFALSKDGKLIAYGGSGRIEIWDVATSTRVQFVQDEMEFGRPATDRSISPVAFAPDNKALLISDVDSNIRLWCWDLSRGELRWQLPIQPDGVTATLPLGWVGDGKFVAIVQQINRECLLQLLRSDNGDCEQKIDLEQPNNDGFPICALSTLGDEFACFQQGNKIKRIELPSGRLLPQLGDSFSNDIVRLAYSEDGKKLAAVEMMSVRLFDLATGRELSRPRNAGFGFQIGNTFLGFRNCRAVFSNDARSLWLTHDDEPAWYWADGNTGRIKRMADLGHRKAVTGVAISRDGQRVATANEEESARIWETATGRPICQLTAALGVKGLTFHPDGKSIVGGAIDSRIVIWDPATGRVRRQIRMPGEGQICQLALDPTGRLIAAAQELNLPVGEETNIRIYDFAEGTERLKLLSQPSSPMSLRFSPDGRLLAVTSTSEATGAGTTIFDATSGAIHRFIPNDASAAEFLPGGNMIAFGTPDGITLWELSSATVRLRIDHPPNDMVDTFAISPNGLFLAGANQSAGTRRVYLWDLRTGEILPPYIGHEHHVTAVTFAADGRLISGSQDTSALVWAVRTETRSKETKKLTDAELRSAWDELSRDGEIAHKAIERLVAAGDVAVAFLGKHLQPVQPIDPRKVDRLLDRLDAARFVDRQKAVMELESMDSQAETFLRRTAELGVSAEARRAAKRLLVRLDGPVTNPDLIRELRCTEILQRISTIESRRLLEKFAAGDPLARLTRAASQCVREMEHKDK